MAETNGTPESKPCIFPQCGRDIGSKGTSSTGLSCGKVFCEAYAEGYSASAVAEKLNMKALWKALETETARRMASEYNARPGPFGWVQQPQSYRDIWLARAHAALLEEWDITSKRRITTNKGSPAMLPLQRLQPFQRRMTLKQFDTIDFSIYHATNGLDIYNPNDLRGGPVEAIHWWPLSGEHPQMDVTMTISIEQRTSEPDAKEGGDRPTEGAPNPNGTPPPGASGPATSRGPGMTPAGTPPSANPGPGPPVPAPAASGEGCPETCPCGGAWGRRAMVIGTPQEGPCPWREARRAGAPPSGDVAPAGTPPSAIPGTERPPIETEPPASGEGCPKGCICSGASKLHQLSQCGGWIGCAIVKCTVDIPCPWGATRRERERAEAAEARCLWLTDAGKANDRRAIEAENQAGRFRAALEWVKGQADFNVSTGRGAGSQLIRDYVRAALSAPGPEREPDPPTGGGP